MLGPLRFAPVLSGTERVHEHARSEVGATGRGPGLKDAHRSFRFVLFEYFTLLYVQINND